MDAETLHQVPAVRLDRSHPDPQPLGNLLRGPPLDHELEDFALTRRERLEPARRGGPARQVFGDVSALAPRNGEGR